MALCVVGLLALHAGLALWGAARNSVTFDENYHLPAGVAAITRGNLWVSALNPPLVKMLCALPAVAAGASLPDSLPRSFRLQDAVGEAFMRVNAARYHHVFLAARGLVVVFSVALGWLVWTWARRLYGGRGGLLALAFYTLAPEALAHGGLVTMDVATSLGFAGSVYALWCFARSGRWGWWIWTAFAVGATALTRFTAVLLIPTLALVALLMVLARPGVRRPRRLGLGLVLLLPTTVLVLNVGYLGQTSFAPLGRMTLHSQVFQSVQHLWPGLRTPLPDAYLAGLDWLMFESRQNMPFYLLGRIHHEPLWYYFPLALLFKWPLGFLLAIPARLVSGLGIGGRSGRLRDDVVVVLPALLFLAAAMFGANLNAGVRYLFPVLPLTCVWLGRLGGGGPSPRVRPPGLRRGITVIGVVLAMAQAAETARAAPWYLSFFNLASGGPGGGYRLLNDSNVDWGQGLIALQEELRRRGIGRIHLAYHGTTDPAVYGIDYVPYFGGRLGPESEWLAVSSYYYVGLRQRMMTQAGLSSEVAFDFAKLQRYPAAEPAGCMFLFRLTVGRARPE
ncbi:MAG: ArnT family glycosyltransferase [Candidatus Eiseniibacteriota bacterium]